MNLQNNLDLISSAESPGTRLIKKCYELLPVEKLSFRELATLVWLNSFVASGLQDFIADRIQSTSFDLVSSTSDLQALIRISKSQKTELHSHIKTKLIELVNHSDGELALMRLPTKDLLNLAFAASSHRVFGEQEWRVL